MKNYYFYNESRLPESFSVPLEFMSFARAENRPDLSPWWFLCDFPSFADFWIDQLREQYPESALVPFAKFGDTDDLACFDGKDLSPSPKVLYIHAFASPGWEMRGEIANFSAWLALAAEDHAEFVKDSAG